MTEQGNQSLLVLNQIISEVYLPALTSTVVADNRVSDTLKNEFLGNIQKFSAHILHAFQQVTGEVKLKIPNIVIQDVKSASEDQKIVAKIEATIEEWNPAIAGLLEREANKSPQGKGAMAEIEFWREKNATFNTLYEQLNNNSVKKMVEVLEVVDSPVLQAFKTVTNDLTKQYNEAKDNVKFLTTLERHFKNLSLGSLSTIKETLPSMMNAIRMVWIISRYYNRDECMTPLLERIAWEICNKVSVVINVRKILRDSDGVKKIEEGKQVLEKWKDTYYEIRDRIEQSESDVTDRWEFDKKRLFDQTDYMAERCGDLLQVAQVLEQFKNILGPELKAVTGDTQHIDFVLQRIEEMIHLIEYFQFDIFDKRYQTSWETVMTKFNENVLQIEEMTKQFIDQSFSNLRSAEGAFELLQNFKSLKSRTTINKQMMDKFSDVLKQYSIELQKIKEIFEINQSSPPFTKNQPPVAGAISWCRSLFHKIKKPIVKFKTLPELMESDLGKAISKDYLTLGKQMRDFENKLYEAWKGSVEQNALQYLKNFILIEKEGRVSVNYHPELVVLIHETKYLDQLGFKIPETALSVTLQEEKYHKYVESLQLMLNSYYSSLDKIVLAERPLMTDFIEELSRVIKPGLESLNWNSLGIPEFIKNTEQEIKRFESTINQIQKNASMIASVVESIATADLIPTLKGKYNSDETSDMQEFLEYVEKHCNNIVEELVRKYKTIPQLLGKIEGIIEHKNTLKSPKMRSYYRFWERRIFNALNRMVLCNLSTLQHLMNLSQRGETKLPALFQVVASLSAPEIIVIPSFNDITRIVNKLLKAVVESSVPFVRWMDGTCIETPPQIVSEDEEPVIFTFNTDISANPQVIKTIFILNQGVNRTFTKINKYLDTWRRFKPLWKMDKTPALERFAARTPTIVDYDTKLMLYAKLGQEAENFALEKEIDFIKVSCSPLESAIKSETNSWLRSIGELLHTSGKSKLNELNEEFSKTEQELARTPETMEDLKFVLNIIDKVVSSSMEIETRYIDIEESYRTIKMYNVPLPPEEIELVNKLRGRWSSLLEQAKLVDESLISVKVQFTETTQKQVELFKKKVAKLNKKFQKSGPGADTIEMDYGLELVKKYQKELARYAKIRDELVLAEKLFNLPITSYPELVEIETELEGLAKIYSLYYDQKEAINKWANTLWADLDIESLNKGIEEFVQKLKRFTPDLKKYRPYAVVTEKINSFRDSIPLFRHLKNEALRPRHWKLLMDITGQSFQTNNKNFTLESIFKMELHKYAEKIEEITGAASKELSIEQGINKIADTWKNIRFEVQKYIKGTEDRGYILKGIDDIIALYDDNSMNLQSMSASRFVSPFLTTVQKWEKTLSTIAEVTEVWMHVQRKWMYLENIYVGSDDIRLQLPEEAKKFDRIDKTFKKIMTETAKNTLVLEACQPDRLELLKSLSTQLEVCQKSLSDYLLTKRNSFPRFFFISDDELLSIIGSQDPTNVQEHMIKIFDNVQSLRFGTTRNNKSILGLNSMEGESILFKQPVMIEGQVENWMSGVEAEMKKTLRSISKEAVFHYPKSNRLNWISQYPGMVTLLGNQIWWTWDVEDTFRQIREGDKHAMKNFSVKSSQRLHELVAFVRRDLSDHDRNKINTLIIIDVHARDIIDRFVRDSILDEKEFEWESQLRFYWDKAIDDVIIRQCTANFNYGYEYLGLSGRLVITPLTERCIMTLTLAMSMKLGGSPAGPAGTGKTETVKDLAKALGLYCVVFNCSEGVDYSTMGNIFSGLVQCGGWGCFDEFNRIDAEVLSVISVQIRTIQTAMRNGLSKFQFEGNEISLDMKTGIFITMNPHYAGRSELPDNLKSMFRPVVMVVPDLELICEIMLFSQGFNQAKVLAKKQTVLYQLAKEQLSKQHHYDFGLRGIKSVLVRAGVLKRETPDVPEAAVLLRAIRDMNLPSFVFEDVPLFLGLINDLFPGVTINRGKDTALHDAIEAAMKEQDYQLIPDQMEKIAQLHETMKTRHTSMVVGPTGGGKTVVLETLAKAQTMMGNPTKLYVINPKAQSVNELYGILDPNTRDWTDGLLSCVFRDINKPSDKKDLKYIVFDGDVDTVWVENMNSVMDDNKLLTLPNGERIRLQKHCSLLFEVSDLKQASPATVSRCGMVYLDPKNLGNRVVFEKWLVTRTKLEGEILRSLYDKYIPPAIDYIFEGVQKDVVTQKLQTIIPVTPIGMVKQLCSMLTVLLTREDIVEARIIECIFIFSVVWSLGASLTEESRVLFDIFLKRISDWHIIENPEMIAGAGQLPGVLPTLYEYFFDTNDVKWVPWSAKIPANSVKLSEQKFYQVLVPTVETVRSTWLLEASIQSHTPLLFVGESGTAKTVTINNYFSKLDPEKYVKLTINFSSRTNSMDLQRTLESNVERWTKGTWGPSPGKHLVVFLDDLNIPAVDKYGTQQPIALLKLIIEKGGFYDRGKELNWKNLRNVQFVAAMAPPGGARNITDPRFLSLFNIVYIPVPSTETLSNIYSTILSNHLEPFHDGIKEVGQVLTTATLKLYNSILTTLPPTPSKFHYLFNLRDLSRVYEGLCLTSLDKFDTRESFVRLWRNEVIRVFSDRLISKEDRKFVNDKITELITEFYSEEAFSSLSNPLVFGDFKVSDESIRVLEDYKTYENVRPYFEESLMNYNEKNIPMNLVLFDDAIEHLVRILRVIRRPRGHALLVGIPGSGKQSLARLASFVARYSIFEISLSRSYGEIEFKEDLKKLYNILGVEGKETVFLFTESHLAKEAFMEYLNNMLTAGIVPTLYSDDEKDSIVNIIRDEVIKARIFDSKENCWNYYVNKCRDNLHIVICMSPGEDLRKRARNFPGLVMNTTIDWFARWPEQALYSVTSAFVAEEQGIPEELKQNIIEHIVSVHLSVNKKSQEFEQQLQRHNYVTPKNFLDFINKYLDLLRQNKKKIADLHKRFDGGLKKLIEAAQYLDQLNAKLVVQKVQVDEKAELNNNLLTMISENKAKVQAKQALATAKERELKELQSQILAKKADAEASLEAALPAVEEARAALTNLNRADITELRSFATPPKAVQAVAQCVCILRGLKDASWKGAKQMMTSVNFLNELLDMNPDEITDKQVKNVKDLLKKNETPPEKMESISIAGAGLMTWVLAILKYSNVAKSVVPKRKAVELALKSQKQNEKDLETIKEEVHTLGQEAIRLEDQYSKGTLEQQELKAQAELMEKRLLAASKLISGLGTERVRWSAEMEGLAEKRRKLTGDSLVAAAFLSYMGPFTNEYRTNMLREWHEDVIKRNIPVSDELKLVDLLADEVEISKWTSEGLPPDELSVQNGLLTTKSSRWPLCIDPQMQAVNWITKKEAKFKLIVRTFHDADFAKQLELSITFGVPMLIEGVDEYIDPLLDPVLEKNIRTSGARKFIVLGDKEVDWNDNFRLYMSTKIANPKYAPGVFGKTMVINYNVTQQGLQDQLLNVVVAFEQPELEQRRESIIAEMSENRGLLKNFEDTLLRELANSSGQMLDNEELISTLEGTKEKAIEIAEKLELAKVTSKEIERLRDGYRLAAKRGAILFFVLSGLSMVSSMYQYALASFLEVFKKSLSLAPYDGVLAKRLKNIIDTLTTQVYNYTCMGLFEKHKLMFAFQMCISIMQGEDQLDYNLLNFVLRGNTSIEKSPRKNPCAWLLEQGWNDLLLLESQAGTFTNITQDLTNNEAKWKAWYDLESPEAAYPALSSQAELSDLQSLALLRCFRTDRMYIAMSAFVSANMGPKFVEPPVVTYQTIYDLSTPYSPIIFILSPGADPGNDVRKLADKLGFSGTKLKEHPLGQNQGPYAASLLENGASRGQWIMLQNCHLLISWLKSLEKLLEKIQEKPHKDFRAWLTTEASPHFPIGILQRALKVVTEPPNGLKLNMASSYSKINEDALSQCPHKAFKPLVYVLAFFHAVVQERRKYGKVGWNIPYDFNESDFSTSLMLLQTYLGKAIKNKEKNVPWFSLRYLIGEVIYGGRVTDAFDRKVLSTYLDEYMGDFLFDTFQPFHFYKSNHVDYKIPADGPLHNYTGMIESLPQFNSPDVFGLHSNAEISYYATTTVEMLNNLVNLQVTKANNNKSSLSNNDSYVSTVAKDIQSKLPEVFDIQLLSKTITEKSPTQIVLFQELERFNALVEVMRTSLHQLGQALLGEIALSNDLEDLYKSLLVGTIPTTWRKLAPDTQMRLSNWVLHFTRRYQQYSQWVNEEPKVMWLSGLHVPESYLKAMIQTACRKNGWALDKTSLFTKVTTYTDPASITERPNVGCYITGVFMEGAGWDPASQCLVRQTPKQLSVEMPIIHIIPIESQRLRLQNTHRAPVYLTQDRANKMGVGLIFEADIPTTEHSSHWTLQGVCLLLNKDV